MALATRVTKNLKYTPPGGPEVTTPTVINATPADENMGVVNVEAETPDETQFQVPFGLITRPTLVRVTNKMNQDIRLFLKADDNANPFKLAPGGQFELAMPVPPSDSHLDGVWFSTTDTVSESGTVEYMIFGDPE
jgi:hypothetical protein